MIENTKAGLEAARARGKKGGRKPAMDAKKVALARTLRADPTLPIGDICRTLGVSKATFYRYTVSIQDIAARENGVLDQNAK